MLRGGCLCGAVRYETSDTPAIIFNCFCATCRRESGAGHLTVVSVKSESVKVSGEIKIALPPGANGAPPCATLGQATRGHSSRGLNRTLVSERDVAAQIPISVNSPLASFRSTTRQVNQQCARQQRQHRFVAYGDSDLQKIALVHRGDGIRSVAREKYSCVASGWSQDVRLTHADLADAF